MTNNVDLSSLPIDEKLRWINDRNIEYSELFQKDALSRQVYLTKHPTGLCAFKCMDGRVHLPAITKTPLGIIKPFRRLGGIFDLGWPFLGEKFMDWLLGQINLAKPVVIFITYHFSKGDNPKRGCAGFNCNLENAKAFAQSFKQQIERIFFKDNSAVHTVIVGMETDEDSLIFHNNGDQIDICDLLEDSHDVVTSKFQKLFHGMADGIINDIMPLVFGNIEHVKETRLSQRPIIETEHREWIVGIGSGFDWLHAPNTALIIGPWSLRPDIDIEKAFSIVRKNMQEHRISKDGFILLISSEYNDIVHQPVKLYHRNIRLEKVNTLKNFALDILNKEEFSDLKDKVKILPVLVDEQTKRFENIQSEIGAISYAKWY